MIFVVSAIAVPFVASLLPDWFRFGASLKRRIGGPSFHPSRRKAVMPWRLPVPSYR